MATESMAELTKAMAEAQKIIGKEGVLPKEKGGLAKDIAAFNKAADETKAAKEAVLDKVLAWKKAVGAIKDDAQAYKDLVDGTDFKLDAKNPEDKKKIEQAQKLLDAACDAYIKIADDATAIIDSTNKTLSSVDKIWDAL